MYFGNGINALGGVIIADNNKTPRYAMGQVPPFAISGVVQCSQAAFGQWQLMAESADADIAGLRFIIRSWVVNTQTQDQAIEALKGVGLVTMPGFASRIFFSRSSTDESEVAGFHAILWTPNGASTGFLVLCIR